MGNFTAVANCAQQGVTTTGTPATGSIPVFSGPQAITTGNLTGDVMTSGGTATTLTGTGVTPGTYVNPTVTIDTKGRIVSASNGGGVGGGPQPNFFNGLALPVPQVSDFTVLADPDFGTRYGLQAAATGVSLYGQNGSFDFVWADRAIPSGGTTGDFKVTGLIKLAALNNGNFAIGITLAGR